MHYFAMDMWETGSTDPVRISPLFSLSLLALSHATRIEALRQLWSNSRARGAVDPTYNQSHLEHQVIVLSFGAILMRDDMTGI